MGTREQIDLFLQAKAFGVVGASADRHKYGNKVLRLYQSKNMRVVPVNPREQEIEGIRCFASVMDLPGDVESISVITPPNITEQVVDMAARKGIKHIWMQPGAESDAAVEACRKSGINVIADGSCILVVLGYRDH